jgi:hypothetical protein
MKRSNSEIIKTHEQSSTARLSECKSEEDKDHQSYPGQPEAADCSLEFDNLMSNIVPSRKRSRQEIKVLENYFK